MTVFRHVEGIQRHLEAIYDLDLPDVRACDFLVGDAEIEAWEQAGVVTSDRDRPEEQLLVLPDADGPSVALYLSDRVRRGLEDGPSLQDHCHATEGVSHFVLLAWSAREERTVRPIDLELQAEVDKAGTALLLLRSSGGGDPRPLLRRLFYEVLLHPDLNAEERDRYRTAHRLGAEYARRLAELMEDGVDALLDELRRFYRLPGVDKLTRAAA
jgi:hypothetical protein